MHDGIFWQKSPPPAPPLSQRNSLKAMRFFFFNMTFTVSIFSAVLFPVFSYYPLASFPSGPLAFNFLCFPLQQCPSLLSRRSPSMISGIKTHRRTFKTVPLLTQILTTEAFQGQFSWHRFGNTEFLNLKVSLSSSVC